MEVIKLRGIKNYRDLGGLKTVDGRILKSHMLIRGTTLFKITSHDINLLKNKYNLKSIVDLRTNKEISERPDSQIEGVSIYKMPIFNEETAGISREKKVRSIDTLVKMPKMEDLYVHMVTHDCLENVVSVLKFILTAEKEKFAFVFHCTAGKDRTGIIAALLLSFLGVDRATIIKDYLMTNKNVRFKASMAYVGLLLLKKNHKLAHKIKHYFMAEPAFIKASLNQLEKDFGSLDNFFKEKLAFSTEQTNQIKNKFLDKIQESECKQNAFFIAS